MTFTKTKKALACLLLIGSISPAFGHNDDNWLITPDPVNGDIELYGNENHYFAVNCGNGKKMKSVVILTKRGDVEYSYLREKVNGKLQTKGTPLKYSLAGKTYDFPATYSEWKTQGHSLRWRKDGITVRTPDGYVFKPAQANLCY